MEIDEKGWLSQKHGLDSKLMDALVCRKNEFFCTVIEEVKSEYKVDFDEFDKSKLEEIELSKAIVRSLLRFEKNSILLGQAVSKHFNEIVNFDKKSMYYTLPYPIIHFPKDTSEAGPKHKDAYDDIPIFFTAWVPLNDYYDKPILIVEKSHLKKENFYLRHLRYRFKPLDLILSPTKYNRTPDIKIGEYFAWNGYTDHSGLLNKTSGITSALVFRFTNVPVYHERTLLLDELDRVEPVEYDYNVREITKKFIGIFRKIYTINSTYANSSKSYLELYIESTELIQSWNLQEHEKEKLSFMLALWAQRLEKVKDVSMFYLYSISSRADSFYGLQYLIRKSIKNYSIEDTLEFIKMIQNKYSSQQVNYAIKKAINKNSTLLSKIDLENKQTNLLSWA
jgi:hypothetical protein